MIRHASASSAGQRGVWGLIALLLILSLACSWTSPAGPTPTAVPTAAQPIPTSPPPTPAAPLPPDLTGSEPSSDAAIGLNQPITLYFNQPMDRASVEASLDSDPDLDASLTWIDDATLTYQTVSPLEPGSRLTLQVDPAAASAQGLPLAEPVSLTFQTVGFLRLTQALPEPGSAAVDTAAAVIAAFNRPVVPLGADPAELPAAFNLEPAAEGRGEWLNTSTYVFYPQPALAGGQQYTVRVNPDLQGAEGSPLEEDISWSFTTDEPRLIRLDPEPGSADLRLDRPVILTFNQPMDPQSVADNFTLNDPLGRPVPGEISWNEDFSEMTFRPAGLLARGSQYRLIMTGAARGAGGTELGGDLNAAFTTVPVLAVRGSNPSAGGLLSTYSNLTVFFSAPVTTTNLLDHVVISPTLPNVNYWWSEQELALRFYGDFAPSSPYTLEISPGLSDPWGGTLGQPYRLNFRTTPLPPSLRVASVYDLLFLPSQDPTLTVHATNIFNVPLSLAPLPEEDFFRLVGPGSYELRRDYRPENPEFLQQALSIVPDRSQAIQLRLTPSGEPLAPGLYFLRLNLPQESGPGGPFILVSSNVQLTFKFSATDALIWAVDLRDNTPVAGAPVAIYRESGDEVERGVTDEQGIFQVDLESALDEPFRTHYAVLGRPGSDTFSLAASTWNQDVEPWNFRLPTSSGKPHLSAYLYSDRPVYRPGQTVYFRAVVRQSYNGRHSMPDVDSLPLTISDDQGEEIARLDLPLSIFGTANGEFQLAPDARPGFYSIRPASGEDTYGSLSFQVAEYRKPEINLQVDFDAPAALRGETIAAEVEARYFFDAPAGDLPLQWTLSARPEPFSLPDYRVGPADTGWLGPRIFSPNPPRFGTVIATGQAETGPEGTARITLAPELPAEIPDGARLRYTLEVTAADESGLPVSARSAAIAHPDDFYIGVRPESWVGRAETPLEFSVQVVDWEGLPAGSRDLRAEFQKVEWVREESATLPFGQTFRPQYTFIGSTDFVTNSEGQARLSFTPPEPGTYQLSVQGGEALTEAIVWAGGPGQAVWPELPDRRLQLTADQADYLPGQEAQIFVPNPFGDEVQALVTVERSRILRHEITAIPAGGSTITLPLTAEEAPNVYVSITLFGPGGLDFRQGYIELPVEPVELVLNVTLTAEPQITGPGEQVTLDLLVTDAEGEPVQGEFSIAVVDLAALALAEPNSRDIVTAFYGQTPLGVRTGLSLAALANRELPPVDGMGGGAEAEPLLIREDFPDTALWDPQVVTGPDGRARVIFTLPDNLTTWQVDARGITEDSRVGQAESELVTSKPLLVRPVVPRFLVVDDRILLAAVVQNNTGEALTIEAGLQATGFLLDEPGAGTQVVTVPPNGRERVEWWGRAQDVESIDLLFSARSGELEDLVRPAGGALPVRAYTARQTFRTAGTLGGTQGEIEKLELVSLPRGFEIQDGELQVELAPSLATAMLNALEALEHYPYECTEQTLSRFLPNLEAYLAFQQFGLDSPQVKDRLDRTLSEGLGRLLARQNPDGGWGWWQGGNSDPYVTAYVLFGLGRAQAAGASVPAGAIERAVAFLQENLADPRADLETWELDRLAFAHFALARSGAGSLADVQSLYELRDRLDPWAQALLAQTLHELSGDAEAVDTLISNLESTAERTSTGAYWPLPEDGGRFGAYRNMTTPLTNSALVVYVLAQREPGTPLLSDAVRYLMAHRTAERGWGSTYASAWTLMALSQVLQGTGELGGEFAFSATLNGAPLASGQAGGPGQLNPVTAVTPVRELRSDYPNALTILREPGQGRLYYTAGLRVSRPVETIAPLDAGLSIRRSYYPQDCPTGAACEPLQSAATGQQVTVRLSLTLPDDAYHLVVEDYIPAGAEILDTRLETSQQAGPVEPAAGPVFDPRSPFEAGWGWWLFSAPQIYDDRITWAVDYLPAGSYELTYTVVLLQAGEYRVLPANAFQFYFPEVQGNSAGEIFTVEP